MRTKNREIADLFEGFGLTIHSTAPEQSNPDVFVAPSSKKDEPKLPNMNEFSPGVVGKLKPLLKLVEANQTDREKLKAAIADAYIKTKGDQRLNRANNILIGMSQCGLFDLSKNSLTALGRELAEESNETIANNSFAKHLLLNCHGLELIDVVKSILLRGGRIGLDAIRNELRSRGFAVTENEGNASKIRQWLEAAGIVDSKWNFSDKHLQELIGASTGLLGEWRLLSKAQRVFLQKVKDSSDHSDPQWIALGPLKKLIEVEWGHGLLPEGRLRAEVLDPLVATNWILAEGKGEGQGGNIGKAKASDKLLNLAVDLPLVVPSTIPVDLLEKLSRSIDSIFEDLGSSDRNVKGTALELLALRIVRDLGLSPVAFRLRGSQTGGAEVDLLADAIHLHYSRWLIQCKNTPSVELSDLAKEVGMAVVLKGHVVALVTTGKFRSTVRQYADQLASNTHLQAVLLDGALLKEYRTKGVGQVIDNLKSQSGRILSLKRPQGEESVSDE